MASYETRARTAIRKAEKNGVISSWATDRESWSLFSKLYSRRMSELNASEEFCFSHDYFIRLMNMHSAHLLLASVDGEVIAGALFLMTDDFMEYHLSASTSEGMRVCATQHLIHTAAEAAAAKRIKYFHLGGGTAKKIHCYSLNRDSQRIDQNITRASGYLMKKSMLTYNING